MGTSTLDSELAVRLQHTYALPRPPATLAELRALFGAMKTPRVDAYLERVREGHSVIGASPTPTPYTNRLVEGDTHVRCAYDALMNALLRDGIAAARCLHCGEGMEIEVQHGSVVRQSSPDLLFWFGTGPIGAPGNPVCDHLHLFPHRHHLDAWLERNPDELGASMPLRDAVAFFTNHPIPPAFIRNP